MTRALRINAQRDFSTTKALRASARTSSQTLTKSVAKPIDRLSRMPYSECMASTGDRVRINLQARTVRHTNDYRERRIFADFAKRVNGKTGVIVGFAYNLINPITVDVDGYGKAQFSSADITEVSS